MRKYLLQNIAHYKNNLFFKALSLNFIKSKLYKAYLQLPIKRLPHYL